MDYRTPAAIDPDRRARLAGLMLLCCALLATVGSFFLAFEARRQYHRAITLPTERVTGGDRLERVLVRVTSGFEKTYASRWRYRFTQGVTLARSALHALLAVALWRMLRRQEVRPIWLWAAGGTLVASTPVTLLAWFFFTRNIGAVYDSFDLIGDRFGTSAGLFILATMGSVLSVMYVATTLWLMRPRPLVAIPVGIERVESAS